MNLILDHNTNSRNCQTTRNNNTFKSTLFGENA